MIWFCLLPLLIYEEIQILYQSCKNLEGKERFIHAQAYFPELGDSWSVQKKHLPLYECIQDGVEDSP
jgi:hypothetical protein